MSGDDHCNHELAGRTRRRRKRRMRKRRTRPRSRASDIQSNNPHLAGGETPTHFSNSVAHSYCHFKSFSDRAWEFLFPFKQVKLEQISVTRKHLWGSIVMGVPPNGWFTRENPTIKWMIWGYPIYGHPHLSYLPKK